MSVDLSKSLVIGISSRALFDLEEANHIFEEKGEIAYAAYQEVKEKEVLKPGIGFYFDDQEAHCRSAAGAVSTAMVPIPILEPHPLSQPREQEVEVS